MRTLGVGDLKPNSTKAEPVSYLISLKKIVYYRVHATPHAISLPYSPLPLLKSHMHSTCKRLF